MEKLANAKRIEVDPECLQWTPLVSGNVLFSDYEAEEKFDKLDNCNSSDIEDAIVDVGDVKDDVYVSCNGDSNVEDPTTNTVVKDEDLTLPELNNNNLQGTDGSSQQNIPSKRRRGRPRKYPLAQLSDNTSETNGDLDDRTESNFTLSDRNYLPSSVDDSNDVDNTIDNPLNLNGLVNNVKNGGDVDYSNGNSDDNDNQGNEASLVVNPANDINNITNATTNNTNNDDSAGILSDEDSHYGDSDLETELH